MPLIQANGISLYYEQHGWDKPADVLVLSNGILMSTASWVYQLPVLAKKYRVLLYDCRGQWQSEHPRAPYAMEQHADDLVALLTALKVERAHIAGISYGAEVSLTFALKYPARTQSLIVASAVSEIGVQLRGIAEMWIAAAQRKDSDLFFQVTYPFNFSEAWIAANVPLLAQARVRYAALDFDAVINLCQAFLQFNVTDQLYRITAPTLVLVGEADTLKPRHYADLIARKISHAEYVVVPGSGHALCWEKFEVFNSLICGFLAKQG